MMKLRGARLFLSIALFGAVAGIAPPILHLARVWWNDRAEMPPPSAAGISDAGRLDQNQPAKVIALESDPSAAEKQIAALIAEASRKGERITISGARHSQGGHTLYPGGIALDMLSFRGMTLNPERRILNVGSGARWEEIIPYLDRHGYAVAVMQSNNDFSVGGSISVNCHGWQHHSPPISASVESFRLITADGQVRRCSRTENGELFSLALGGYGLFGVILNVELRVVPNEFYRAESKRLSPADYVRIYREITASPEIGMAYGRVSVAPASFLEEATITVLRRQITDRPTRDTLRDPIPGTLKRLVFRGSVESDYGKNLRWKLETRIGQTGGKIQSRNEIMNVPSSWFGNRDSERTEILQEYFIPPAQFARFLQLARPILLQHQPDLLNITVRAVEKDDLTFLNYARTEVFGLVMLFNQKRDKAADAAMEKLSVELIEAALACGGTYYLPYRPHATVEQFRRAYPQSERFFQRKKFYDPAGIFRNQYFAKYENASD